MTKSKIEEAQEEAMAKLGEVNRLLDELIPETDALSGTEEWSVLLDKVNRIFLENRSIEGPFIIIHGGLALYPQYDLSSLVTRWLYDPETMQWLASEARRHLDSGQPSVDFVREHWRHLSTFDPGA